MILLLYHVDLQQLKWKYMLLLLPVYILAQSELLQSFVILVTMLKLWMDDESSFVCIAAITYSIG